MGTWGSTVGAAGKSVNNWFSGNRASAKANNQAWRRTMEASNTAYQRGVADMKKAGLNPMLAYSQGGASTPQAQPAGTQAVGSEFVKAYTGISAAGAQRSVAQATTANLQANTAKASNEAQNTAVDTKQRELQYSRDLQTTPQKVAQEGLTTQKLQSDLDLLRENIAKATAEAGSARSVADNKATELRLRNEALALGNRAAALKMTQAELDQRMAKFKLDMLTGAGHNFARGYGMDKVLEAIQNGYDAAKKKGGELYDKAKPKVKKFLNESHIPGG